MTIKHQLLFWGSALGVLIGFILIFKTILLPFILGIAIAYLLNPMIVKLTHIGLRRKFSSIIILILFITALILSTALLLPALMREIVEFSRNLPQYYDLFVEYIDRQLQNLQPVLQQITGHEDSFKLSSIVNSNADKGFDALKHILSGLTFGGQTLFNALSLIALTPIVAFFMINEWPGITNKIEDLLPHDHRKTIHRLWDDIDHKLSGFVRGQISVAFILGLCYALALSLAGLKYGLLIGFGAGLLSIIPLFGSIVGLITSIAVAWFQMGSLVFVGLIAAIFLIGQLIESNLLTPKLIGDSVGLHPLWIIFSLMAGGSLFGILGMLIAIPIAATAAVIISFILEEYKDSVLYKPTKKKMSKK